MNLTLKQKIALALKNRQRQGTAESVNSFEPPKNTFASVESTAELPKVSTQPVFAQGEKLTSPNFFRLKKKLRKV